MKTNKFFAMAFAAITMIGFAACNSTNPDELSLDKTAISLSVGQTETITANMEATWVSSNPATATVVGNGKTATVTAVANGTALITATADGLTKTCVVSVGSTVGAIGTFKGSQVWPIILDGTTYDANESKIVASFQPNDVDQFLYVWEDTYNGGSSTGLNFHGNTDGYTALVVAKDWSGAGFCLTDKENGNGWEAAKALNDSIVADPDSYFLHLAIKSTDNYSHCFYIMGSEETKFVLGTNGVYAGKVYDNFTRDGSWYEFDIPMSAYAAALANADVKAGVNVFVMLTEGVPGAQLNLDAVYFYKK